MNAEIVSGKNREIIKIANWFYIYVPLNAKEKKQFAKDVINPCWRMAIRESK